MLEKIRSHLFSKNSLIALSLLLLTFVTRYAVIGNPFIDYDETFYLFTGGRLLHGELPYIDIWDRKPIGIFIIYAFFHLFGAWRLWAYQIGALVCVWITALLVIRTARLIAPQAGAIFAGALYIVWTVLAHGEGGQSPIFYNVLVTSAMLLLAYHLPELRRNHNIRRLGMWIMALFGLSMQIKYTTIFEGMYAGLVLLWSAYRAHRKWKNIAIDALLWIFTALAPTVVAFSFYINIGHAHDWWFANIQSILLRSMPASLHNGLWMLLVGSLLAAAIPLQFLLKIRIAVEHKNQLIFLTGWALSALIGVAFFGTYIRHYALPLVAPCVIMAAPLWHKNIGKIWLLGLMIFGIIKGYQVEKKVVIRNSHNAFMTMSHVISSPIGCLFEYDGPTFLLDTPSYCSLTRYPFQGHLRLEGEKNALGIDPVKEAQRIIALKPLYIVANRHGEQPDTNASVDKVIYTALAKEYTPAYEQRSDDDDSVIIYKLKEASIRAPSIP